MPPQRPPLKIGFSPIGPDGHIRPWAEIECEVIDRALAVLGGNVTAVCAALGIGSTLIADWAGCLQMIANDLTSIAL